MNYETIANRLLESAMRAGAEEADVYLSEGREFEATLRAGDIEVLKQARSKGVGLRVLADKRLGFTHSTDFSDETLRRMVEESVAMARRATRDEFLGIPDPPSATAHTNLDLVDASLGSIATEQKIGFAREMEEAALAHDPRVKVVEGATVSDGEEHVFIANSKGFSGAYRSTATVLSCSVVAEQNGKREVNHWYSSKRHMADHPPAATIGEQAAERAVGMLNARKVQSGSYPVVLHPHMAASLLGAVAGALNGESVYRKMSFLTDKLGERVASEHVTIVDDGLLPRGFGSRPFDAEGTPTERKVVVDRGVLQTYLYDSYTARKVQRSSTGNAVRGYASAPHIRHLNIFIQPGPHDPEHIIRSVDRGFYVTGMIGFGVDTVTGRFSRGASGLWIEQGECIFPVHEVTIAGSLLEMFQNVRMVGNDLEFNGSIASPTLRIDGMTLAGL